MRIIFYLLLITFISCENVAMDKVETIILDNNSNEQLKYHIGIDSSPLIYPNTSLPVSDADFYLSNITTNVILGNSRKWESRISELPSDTLSIYFFHPDTLANNTWDEIRTDYKVLKRYDLSLQDLELLNFKVSYPPNSDMLNMQMYPIE